MQLELNIMLVYHADMKKRERKTIRDYFNWRKKNNIIIGRMYEKHIQRLLELSDWVVHDKAKYGVYDRGIDLIATHEGVTRYVQCKVISRKAQLHEDVIHQFYGSVNKCIDPTDTNTNQLYIYTTTEPSDYASSVARNFGIKIITVDFPGWPARKYTREQLSKFR